MGNLLCLKRHKYRKSSTFSTAPKDDYFNSTYALLIGYKSDEELMATMKSIKDTVNNGLVTADCFVDNQVAECLVGLLDNSNPKIQLLALSTLSSIVADETAKHTRETPVADLLIDCGFLQKLQMLLKNHPESETIYGATECLVELMVENGDVITTLIDSGTMSEISRILEGADDEGQTAILNFLFTAIRRANPRQIEQFTDAEIMDPVSEVIFTPSSKDSIQQLAVKVINTLVKKSVRQRDRNNEALKRFQFVSNHSLCDHLPTGNESRRQSTQNDKN